MAELAITPKSPPGEKPERKRRGPPPRDGSEVLIDVQELMRRLYCGRSAAYALVSSGTLPGLRVGRSVRIPASAVDVFIAAGGVRVIPKASSNGASKPKRRATVQEK